MDWSTLYPCMPFAVLTNFASMSNGCFKIDEESIKDGIKFITFFKTLKDSHFYFGREILKKYS